MGRCPSTLIGDEHQPLICSRISLVRHRHAFIRAHLIVRVAIAYVGSRRSTVTSRMLEGSEEGPAGSLLRLTGLHPTAVGDLCSRAGSVYHRTGE